MQNDKNNKEESSEEEEQQDNVSMGDSLSRGSSATLLSVLDDKNRVIEVLQQQLQNQKLQLVYYIKNALKSSKIMQLAKTCQPDAVDGNIPLTLALSNFYKQTGMKSRLMNLYERMTAIEEQIQNMICRQEFILKEIFEKFIGRTCMTNFTICHKEDTISQPFSNKQQFEMLNEMLNATVSLSGELDRYRLCCNKLIVIEDERNALVEQVYSMPIEERAHCNYILVIQMEKSLLEKEMRDIRREQKQLQAKLRQLRVIEKGLREAQMNGIYGDDNFGTQLIDMLESVREDALALLTISKSQKCRYHNELTKLTSENKSLQQKVNNMQQFVSEKGIVKAGTETSLHKDICEKCDTMKELQLQLKMKENENESLRQTINELRNEIRELETSRLNVDIEKLQAECENYKSQVDDLEAIRRAYSQLVENHPNIETQLNSKEKELKELQAQHDQLLLEITKLRKTSTLQQYQIKYLLKIIDKLAESKDEGKSETISYSQNNTTDSQNNFQKLIPNKSELTSTYGLINNEVSQALILAGKQSFKNQDNPIAASKSKKDEEIINKNSCATEIDEGFQNVQNHIPLISKTTFEVERTDKYGKIEKVKAILESNASIQGIVHLENTNKLSLEVKCKTANNTNVPHVDEYELMKDCSKETIPSICGNWNHKVDFLETRKVRTEEIMKDSKKIVDVIEYKRPPSPSDGEYGSCWEEDGSSSSSDIYCQSSTSDNLEDTAQSENNEKNHRIADTLKNELAFNQLIRINKSLKVMTTTIENVLKNPEGKASVISTLHEVYRSLFSTYQN